MTLQRYSPIQLGDRGISDGQSSFEATFLFAVGEAIGAM
jgi:hypothetical protein